MPVARYGGNNIVPACTDTAVGTYVTLQLIVSCSAHTEDCYEEQDVLVCTKGNTAQFGKKPRPGFLAQFKVWKTKEYCMYPQGVCRIRKPAYAGNGCAIFLVFQTEEVGQKDGCGSQTQLRGVALTEIKMKNLLILTCNIRRSVVAFTY